MMEKVALVSVLIVYSLYNKDTIDRDECTEGTHKCGSNGNCENTKGSYICHCRRGYQTPSWNPRICIGIIGLIIVTRNSP